MQSCPKPNKEGQYSGSIKGIVEKHTNGLVTTDGIKIGTETLDTFDEIDSPRIDGSSYSPNERVGVGAEA